MVDFIQKKYHKRRVAVIGSGLKGLAVAYRLLRCGYEVAIFERKRQAEQQRSGDPFQIDLLRHTNELSELIEELGLDREVVFTSSVPGKVVVWHATGKETVTDVSGLYPGFFKKWMPGILGLFSFGYGFTQSDLYLKYLERFIKEKLSFGGIRKIQDRIITFNNGNSSLKDALVKKVSSQICYGEELVNLRPLGDRFQLTFRSGKVSRTKIFDQVVLAVAPENFPDFCYDFTSVEPNRILAGLIPSFHRLALVFNASAVKWPENVRMVVQEDNEDPLLAIVPVSELFPDSTPEDKVVFHVFVHRDSFGRGKLENELYEWVLARMEAKGLIQEVPQGKSLRSVRSVFENPGEILPQGVVPLELAYPGLHICPGLGELPVGLQKRGSVGPASDVGVATRCNTGKTVTSFS